MTSPNFAPDQIDTMQQVYAEAKAENVSSTQMLALFEAAAVESGFRNLPYGDADSQGVFQERPSQGWHDVMNIPAATQQLIAHMDTSLSDPGAMAQSAERSAFPDRYDAMMAEAQAMLTTVAGGNYVPNPGGPTTAGSSSTTQGGTSGGIAAVALGLAPRLGLIIFGGLIVFVGMWVTIGHPPQDIPIVGGLYGKPKRKAA